jgi:hypothetical protein
MPVDLEVFDGGLTVNLKISLKERNPPCTVKFEYIKKREINSNGLQKGDLFVYVSRVQKDPNEENNQGKYINVR